MQFWLLPHPGQRQAPSPNGLPGVTVTDRYVSLVTAAYGTRVARPGENDDASPVAATASSLPRGRGPSAVTSTSGGWDPPDTPTMV
jgi:hypothetical protein